MYIWFKTNKLTVSYQYMSALCYREIHLLRFISCYCTLMYTRERRCYIIGNVLRPRQDCEDGKGQQSETEPTKGRGTAGGGRFQCVPGNPGGGQEGGRHRDKAGDGVTGGHGNTLPAAGEQVVSGLEDVGDTPKGKGDAVPDGLHPGDGPPSLQERRRPGSSAQLGPLHGPGLSAERPSNRAQEIPGQ